jgi:hypothetical protein
VRALQYLAQSQNIRYLQSQKSPPERIRGAPHMLSRSDPDRSRNHESLVIASLGDHELGHSLSRADGSLHMSIRVPLEASDENTITVLFIPVKPWIAGNRA